MLKLNLELKIKKNKEIESNCMTNKFHEIYDQSLNNPEKLFQIR